MDNLMLRRGRHPQNVQMRKKSRLKMGDVFDLMTYENWLIRQRMSLYPRKTEFD